MEFLLQIFLTKVADKAVERLLKTLDQRVWPKARDILKDLLKRRATMVRSGVLRINVDFSVMYFEIVSCDTGDVLGHCLLVSDDGKPDVYTEAKFEIYGGRAWSNYDLYIKDDFAQEYVRRNVEYEIKELFVVLPANIDLSE